jgi:hypothetical protein
MHAPLSEANHAYTLPSTCTTSSLALASPATASRNLVERGVTRLDTARATIYAKQKRQVDPAIRITVLEHTSVCLVQQVLSVQHTMLFFLEAAFLPDWIGNAVRPELVWATQVNLALWD